LKKVTEFGVGIGIGIEERAILAIVMKMGGWSDSVKEPEITYSLGNETNLPRFHGISRNDDSDPDSDTDEKTDK